MTLQDSIVAVTAVISLGTALVSIWNAWTNKSIALIVSELKLNIMREMNGKYERIDDAADLKRRLERLEASKMRIHNAGS